MNSAFPSVFEIIDNVYESGIKPLIVEKEKYAYIKDPVFDIKRNRVVAEVLKAIINSNLEVDEKIVAKLCRYLEKTQNNYVNFLTMYC